MLDLRALPPRGVCGQLENHVVVGDLEGGQAWSMFVSLVYIPSASKVINLYFIQFNIIECNIDIHHDLFMGLWGRGGGGGTPPWPTRLLLYT